MPPRTWRHTWDATLAVALVVLSFVPGAEHQGVDLGEFGNRQLDTAGILLLLGQALPLVVRRRWPATCLAVVGGSFIAFQLLRYPTAFASLALLIALYSVGAHHTRHRITTAVTAAAVYVAFVAALRAAGSPETVAEYVTFSFVLVTCWSFGRWTREHTERRRRAEEEIVVAERARIARELHDTVTNHVTAMVVQADAAQYATGDNVTVGLRAISDAGRDALTDLRYLLGALQGYGDIEKQAGTLPDLVARSRAAGQPVELVEHGEPRPMAGPAEMAAYRVVQEALTNALKHAAGKRTVVELHHGDQWLELAVTTAGTTRTGLGRGSGRGLVGMRERVSVVGGDLSAGASPDGGFRVSARIPLGVT
jgi:signal transduction histidine kinase